MLHAFLLGCAAVILMMIALWLVSLRLRDVSIIDSFWSLGFVISAWVYRWHGPESLDFHWLHLALVSIWGLRLSAYIAIRHWRHGEEDYRYQQMRQRHGDRFPLVSLLRVFLLQAALICVIAPPLLLAQFRGPDAGGDGWRWLDIVAVCLWLIGFIFEAGGDWQMARFKARSDSQGQVMNRGLWAWTRHPNYFGDACIWWSFFLFALGTHGGWWTLLSSAAMTFLLLKVSGVALLEKDISERRPGYREYKENTPAFFPKPPWLKSKARS